MLDHSKEKPPLGGADEPAPVPMRAPFRAAAWVLGACLCAFPALLGMWLAWRVATGREPASSILMEMALALPVLPFGLMILRMARSGLDPQSEDRAIEAAESRAFLAAVERLDESAGR